MQLHDALSRSQQALSAVEELLVDQLKFRAREIAFVFLSGPDSEIPGRTIGYK
jgi:hypothetical protein